MGMFTVIGYLTKGNDSGASLLEFVDADSPMAAHKIIHDWYERNARVIAVIPGKWEVYRPAGLIFGPAYTDKVKSISQKRMMQRQERTGTLV